MLRLVIEEFFNALDVVFEWLDNSCPKAIAVELVKCCSMWQVL